MVWAGPYFSEGWRKRGVKRRAFFCDDIRYYFSSYYWGVLFRVLSAEGASEKKPFRLVPLKIEAETILSR